MSDLRTFEEIKIAAEQGDVGAQLDCGIMLWDGNGVPQNRSKAVEWFIRCAERGEPIAQYALGSAYASGTGVAKSESEASVYFMLAAEQGFAPAQCKIGWRFLGLGGFIRGVRPDDIEAHKWIRKAADQGDPEGMSMLGFLYRYGRGVTKSETEALKWYQRAAEKGDPVAQKALKEMASPGRRILSGLFTNSRGSFRFYDDRYGWRLWS